MEPRHFTDPALASGTLARNSWCKEQRLQNESLPDHPKEELRHQELQRQGKVTLALPPKPSRTRRHPPNSLNSRFRATLIIY